MARAGDVSQSAGDRLGDGRPGRGVALAVLAGAGFAVAAAVALWSGQGAEIFLSQAFAALAACF